MPRKHIQKQRVKVKKYFTILKNSKIRKELRYVEVPEDGNKTTSIEQASRWQKMAAKYVR